MEVRVERCAEHGLHYDPAVTTGCVLCRKGQASLNPDRRKRSIVGIGVAAVVLLGGLVLAKTWGGGPAAVHSLAIASAAALSSAAPGAVRQRGRLSRAAAFEQARVQALACPTGGEPECSEALLACTEVVPNIGSNISSNPTPNPAPNPAVRPRGARPGDADLQVPSTCIELQRKMVAACEQDAPAACAALAQHNPSFNARACDLGTSFACASLAMTLRDPIESEAARLRGEKLRDCPKGPGAPCVVAARTELLGAARDVLAERARQGCRSGTGADCARVARESEAIKPPDLALIAELRRAGCDKGDSESCTALASIYAEGRGVPKDERRALALFDQMSGDTEAALNDCDGGAECELTKHLATVGRPKIERNRAELAPALISDECNAGRIASCSALAEYYAVGRHADAAKAATFAQRTRTLLDSACRSGDKHACESIAANDTFVPGADKTRGRAFYDQECRSGDFKACWSLADSHRLESRSVNPPPAAIDAYRRGVALADPACSAGDSVACQLMLAAYASGLGVQRDEKRAMHYARRVTDLMRAKP